MSDDVQAKLREKLAAKEKRETQRDAEVAGRKLQELELEEKFEAELGQRGSMFEIIATIEGPVVLKLGEAVLLKKFQAKLPDATMEDMHAFVWPCVVHPAIEKFNELAARRPALLVLCADALSGLFQGKELAVTKK